MDRLSAISNQLSANNASSNKQKLFEKHADDVVIVGAYRTALTKGGRGLFKDTSSADILCGLLEGLIKRTGVDPKIIGDVVVGNVLNTGSGVTEHRAAAIAAGIPYTVPFAAVNRQCSSGLVAINDIANKIRAGQIDIGIGAGVEAMSQNYGTRAVANLSDKILSNPDAASCQIPMGITSENVASKYDISRAAQDKFSANSYQKAEKAQKAGLYDQEIIPIEATVVDDKGDEHKVTVSKDEGIRPGTTAESLGKIKPAFKKDGSTHAGNASQISDGAGAVLLARRSVAEKLGLPIIGKFIHCKVVGVPPEIMGVGPAYAIPSVLNDLGLTHEDVDVFEINEAFASQAIFSIEHIGIPYEKVNPRGGAIAIGHPLGATGARQYATLFSELKSTGKKVGVTSMCIGTGMGAASLVVSEQ